MTSSEAGSDQTSLSSCFPPGLGSTRRHSFEDSTSSERTSSLSSSTKANPNASSTNEVFGSNQKGSAQRGTFPSLAERCLDAFYQFFHGAHPFVVPKPFLHQFFYTGRLDPLMAAMRWVGSLYIDFGAGSQSLLDEACHQVFSSSGPRDVFLLQAMMILLISFDGRGDCDRAKDTLLDAETLAIELALNTRPFALLHGQGSQVLEESLRRTWWELYVVDGTFAGARRVTNFALFDIPTDVALPCEEAEFQSGEIPPPRYLDELDERHFTDDDRKFSSFSYRILSARNLARCLRVPSIAEAGEDEMARLEGFLTDWRLNLPAGKRTPVDRYGCVDEMMFQAFMLNYATSLLIHQPLSQLGVLQSMNVSADSPYALFTEVITGQALNTHTRHALASATDISNLITHRVPILSHTHFFTCAIAASSTVHLAKWSLHFMQYDDDDIRRYLRLNIGALEELSAVWPVAAVVKGKVQAAARELYQTKKAAQATPRFWIDFTNEQGNGLRASHEWNPGEAEQPPDHGQHDSDYDYDSTGLGSTQRSSVDGGEDQG